MEALEKVREVLNSAKVALESAGLARLPKITKTLGGADAELGMNLIETLKHHQDVQTVHTDFEPSEDAIASRQ